MNFRKIIYIVEIFAVFGLSGANFKIAKISQSPFVRPLNSISVPNPNPPYGQNLVRDKYSKLPINALTEPETISVCAIRVQFQLDSTPTSTGTGQFVLEPDSTQVFDPPPHDKNYFETHLDALARYYYFVSHGKAIVRYTVFPENDTSSYTLPDSMGYYGPDSWFGNDLGARLGGFFTDAILLADSLDTIDWCDYDVVIIFHAGSDWQDDVASFYPDYAEYYPDIFIPSPDDLPTAFIVMPEPVVACVDRGVVMPESPSQDGQLVVLNGILAHEFGHAAFGLIDLYSTYDFYPAVGYFSIMDSGHNIAVALIDSASGDTFVVSGVLPVYPMAWERAYIGWENVFNLTESTNAFNLRACEMPLDTTDSSSTIAKIPIDEFEYYLLENRKAEIWSYDDDIAIKQDSATGVIEGIQVNNEYVGAYDYLLPSSGMLVWRVDERVAYGDYDDNGTNNFEDNELQWNWQHPFIQLIEADGIQNIGMLNDEYFLGSAEDYFDWPNNTHFGPNTEPSSNSWNGSYTGIDISDISKADTVMTFSFQYVGPHLIWEKTVGFPLDDELTAVDIDGDSISEIIGTTNGMVFIWRTDGSQMLDNTDSVGLIIYDGDTLAYPLPIVFELDTNCTSVSVGDIFNDGTQELVLGDDAGNLWMLYPDTTGNRFPAVTGFPVNLGGSIKVPPVIISDINGDGIREIIVGTDDGILTVMSGSSIYWQYNMRGKFIGAFKLPDDRIGAIAQQTLGRLYIFSSDGEFLVQKDLPVGDLNTPAVAIRDDDTLIILTSKGVTNETGGSITTSPAPVGKPLPNGEPEGELLIIDTQGEIVDGFPVELYNEPSTPVLANGIDIWSSSDSDGDIVRGDRRFEIVFTADTLLYCYHDNGAPCENFPIVLYDDNFVSSPAIADFDGDSRIDIIAVSENSRLYAFKFDGELIGNYPLAVGESDIMPVAINVDRTDISGNISLFIGSYQGILYRWDGFGDECFGEEWGQFGLSSYYNRVWYAPYLSNSSLTNRGLVEFYNYPNPVKDITYFRYILTNSGDVELTIYNENGTIIKKFKDNAEKDVPNEIMWNTAGVSSGIYIAILSAKFDDKTETKKQVLAVIK